MVFQSPNSRPQNIDVLGAFKFIIKTEFRNIHVSKISGPIKIWTKQAQTQSHFKMFSAPFDIQIPKAKNNHQKPMTKSEIQCWTSSFSFIELMQRPKILKNMDFESIRANNPEALRMSSHKGHMTSLFSSPYIFLLYRNLSVNSFHLRIFNPDYIALLP